MTNDEFLALLAQNPTDVATLTIYADHWEEQADLDRAQFLRTDSKLRAAVPPMTDEHWALGEELRVLGDAIVAKDAAGGAAWIEAVSHPRVRGTSWNGTSGTSKFEGRFLAEGALNYTQSSGTFQNGTWTQYGSLVTFEMNLHYADYTGLLVGGKLYGKAKNITRATWEWFLAPLDLPIEIPSDTNTNVYPWSKREVPAKKKKKKAAKKKAAAKKAAAKKAAAKKAAAKPSSARSAKMNKPVKKLVGKVAKPVAKKPAAKKAAAKKPAAKKPAAKKR